MKTLDELFNEIISSESDEFKDEFFTSFNDKKRLQAFLKKYDCQATAEEFQEYLQEKMQNNEEVSDEELESINGGSWWNLGALSVITGIVGCLGHAIASCVKSANDVDQHKITPDLDWKGLAQTAACDF